MAFRLQDEAKQLKGLFKDLVSLRPLIVNIGVAYLVM